MRRCYPVFSLLVILNKTSLAERYTEYQRISPEGLGEHGPTCGGANPDEVPIPVQTPRLHPSNDHEAANLYRRCEPAAKAERNKQIDWVS